MNHPYEIEISDEFKPRTGSLPKDPLEKVRLEWELRNNFSYYERSAGRMGAGTPSVRQDPETGEYYIGADVYSP